MTMTRQHFEAIAEVLRLSRHRGVTDEHATRVLASDFAEMLAHTNPNFNRERFITASTRDV